MKKIRGLIIVVLFSILFILSSSKNVQAYSTIHSNEIFPTGTLDSLWLNYTTLPQVSITGSVGSSVYDTSYSGNNIVTGYTYRRAQLYPGGNGAIDSTITANFYNCGMLNGRSVNINIEHLDEVYEYNDIDTIVNELIQTDEWTEYENSIFRHSCKQFK